MRRGRFGRFLLAERLLEGASQLQVDNREKTEREGEQTRGTLPKVQLKEEEEECAGESGGNSEEKK